MVGIEKVGLFVNQEIFIETSNRSNNSDEKSIYKVNSDNCKGQTTAHLPPKVRFLRIGTM